MTSPSRRIERAQQAAAKKQALAGMGARAVDLGAVKASQGGNPEKQQEIANNFLRQNGFLCTCGERFRTEAISVMGYNLGRFPSQEMTMTPQGPKQVNKMEDGCQPVGAHYCSRTCPDFLDAMEHGIPVPEGEKRPKIRAIRQFLAIEWTDETEVPA